MTLSLEPGINPWCYRNDDGCLNAKVELTNINTSKPVSEFTFNVSPGKTYYLILEPQGQLFTDTPGKVDITESDKVDLTTLNPPNISIKD